MKFSDGNSGCDSTDGAVASTGDVVARTRDAVARAIVLRGPQCAAELAEDLGVSAAAIRRHLDALVAEGLLSEREPREPRPGVRRGRGRPARAYALTDAGRAALPHAYDDLAVTALRYLRDTGGEHAVDAFADHRASSLAAELAASVDASLPVDARAAALAGSLSAQGYASTTEGAGVDGRGVQLCQHHCPVAHVAAEFPQLCEAETRAFERVLGTRVQRLATIAHGDGVCTTHVPVDHAVPVDHTGISTAPTAPSGRTA